MFIVFMVDPSWGYLNSMEQGETGLFQSNAVHPSVVMTQGLVLFPSLLLDVLAG